MHADGVTAQHIYNWYRREADSEAHAEFVEDKVVMHYHGICKCRCTLMMKTFFHAIYCLYLFCCAIYHLSCYSICTMHFIVVIPSSPWSFPHFFPSFSPLFLHCPSPPFILSPQTTLLTTPIPTLPFPLHLNNQIWLSEDLALSGQLYSTSIPVI